MQMGHFFFFNEAYNFPENILAFYEEYAKSTKDLCT